MRKSFLIAAALAAAATPFAGHAQNSSDNPAEGATQADVRRGVVILRSFVNALNSDKIDQTRKGRYIACLYNNPVRRISVAAGKIIAGNDKLEDTNPSHVFTAASAVCRALPTQAQGAAAQGAQPEGR